VIVSHHPDPQLQGACHAHFYVLRRGSARELGLSQLFGYFYGFGPRGEFLPHPLNLGTSGNFYTGLFGVLTACLPLVGWLAMNPFCLNLAASRPSRCLDPLSSRPQQGRGFKGPIAS